MGRRSWYVAGLALLLAGCGGTPTSTPLDSTAASAHPTAETASASGTGSAPSVPTRSGTAPASGGDVPDGVPRTVAAAEGLVRRYSRSLAAPVAGERVASIDGTTCRLGGVALCRVGEGIAVTGYCPPPAEAEVVAVAVTRQRATPVCGGVPLPGPAARADARRLPDGQVTAAGLTMRCAGVEAGVLCVSRSGDAGFFLSLDGYRVLR